MSSSPIDMLAKLSVNWAEAYNSGMHADCKIICGPYVANVHKMVLIGHSDWFRAVLKPRTFKEGETGDIVIKALSTDTSGTENQSDADDDGDDPMIIQLMVMYFYTFEYYCSGSPNSPDTVAAIVTHAKLFAAAIKYQVDGLRELAAKKFQDMVTSSWSQDPFKDAAFCDAFAEAITVVFNSTAEEVSQLREIVLETLLDNFEALKANHAVKDAMNSIPDLGYQLLRRTHLRPPAYERSSFVFTCKICRQVRCEYPKKESEDCDRCITTWGYSSAT